MGKISALAMMVISAITGLSVFAEEDVDIPEVSVVELAGEERPDDLHVAYCFSFLDEQERVDALAEKYGDWSANFVVTFDHDVEMGSVVLKGSYGDYGWLELGMPGSLEADEEWLLLPENMVTYNDVVYSVGEFYCGVRNCLADNKDVTMTVSLILSNDEGEVEELKTVEYKLEAPRWSDVGVWSPLENIPGAEAIVAALPDDGRTSAVEVIEWASGVGKVPYGENIKLNAFVLNQPNAASDEELQKVVDAQLGALLKEFMKTGTVDFEALEERYPNAKVEVLDVSDGFVGVDTSRTRLFKLRMTIK